MHGFRLQTCVYSPQSTPMTTLFLHNLFNLDLQRGSFTKVPYRFDPPESPNHTKPAPSLIPEPQHVPTWTSPASPTNIDCVLILLDG